MTGFGSPFQTIKTLAPLPNLANSYGDVRIEQCLSLPICLPGHADASDGPSWRGQDHGCRVARLRTAAPQQRRPRQPHLSLSASSKSRSDAIVRPDRMFVTRALQSLDCHASTVLIGAGLPSLCAPRRSSPGVTPKRARKARLKCGAETKPFV
jgi:hypothetical protein